MKNDLAVRTSLPTAPKLWKNVTALLRERPPGTAGTEHYRHELKCRISYAEKAALEVRMRPILQYDRHAQQGGYLIRSLYFDDCWNSACEEKNAGVLLRKKYRIRIYDLSDRVIRLERKKKYGSFICKETASLTRAELECILAGDYAFLLSAASLPGILL